MVTRSARVVRPVKARKAGRNLRTIDDGVRISDDGVRISDDRWSSLHPRLRDLFLVFENEFPGDILVTTGGVIIFFDEDQPR
jgi:hypothetical protein